MKIHIIMHESFEDAAAIRIWAEKKKHPVTYSHLYKGDKLPKTCDKFDFLIIMGGPQSPKTTIEECPHFNAKQEIRFIKKAIDANKLVLGVCLGAQMIGNALGAKFEHSPNKEIGVFEIILTKEAKSDLIFSTFPQKFLVGHWHGDMPGLTKEAKVLAVSEGCPRQIIRYSAKVYGFQCHFEFTPEAIEGMIINCSDELKKLKNLSYVQNENELRRQNYSEMNKLLFRFLDQIEASFEP